MRWGWFFYGGVDAGGGEFYDVIDHGGQIGEGGIIAIETGEEVFDLDDVNELGDEGVETADGGVLFEVGAGAIEGVEEGGADGMDHFFVDHAFGQPRVGELPHHEFDEIGPLVVFEERLKEDMGKGADEGLEGGVWALLDEDVLDAFDADLPEMGKMFVKDVVIEGEFVLEMVVDGGDVAFGQGGDVSDAGGVKALVGKELVSGVEEASFGLGVSGDVICRCFHGVKTVVSNISIKHLF